MTNYFLPNSLVLLFSLCNLGGCLLSVYGTRYGAGVCGVLLPKQSNQTGNKDTIEILVRWFDDSLCATEALLPTGSHWREEDAGL